MSSLTNLGVNLYLVSVVSPELYGQYVLAFVTTLFFVALLDALWLTQMVVRAGSLDESELTNHGQRCLAAGLLHVLPLGCIVATASLVGHQLIGGEAFLYTTIIPLAIVGMVFRDFMFRYGYIRGAEGKVLVGQLVFSLALGAMLVTYHLWGGLESPVYVLLFYMGAAAIAALTTYRSLGLQGTRLVWRTAVQTRNNLLRSGKWAGGSTVVEWALLQSANYALVFVAGVAAVGESNAARILLSPFVMLSPGVQAVALPKLSRLWSSSPERALRWGYRLTWLMGLLCIGYCVVLWFLLDWLEVHFFAPRGYEDVRLFVIAWMVVVCFDLAKSQLSLIMKAADKFRRLLQVVAISAIVAVGSAFLLGQLIGGAGAVLGLAVGEMVIVALLAGSLFRLNVDTRLK